MPYLILYYEKSLQMTGYVVLYFTRSAVPVFIGSLCMMTGYMTVMAVFGAMIRDHIPQGKSGQFQGIRIIGPAIGAWVLRDAEMIVNQDGTASFLPDEGIWAAAFVTGLILCVGLVMVFRSMKAAGKNSGMKKEAV